MKIKVLLAALALAAAPGLASAMCSWSAHGTEQAMTCAEGTVWDATSQTCVTAATS
jgi:hypothetical protein